MNKTGSTSALLPNGFEDLLHPQASQEAGAVNVLMGLFEGFGYGRVRPPKLEFEDGLLAQGPGESVKDNTFRVMDPVSHRMMVLSSDLTAQVTRIAGSRLRNKPRPLRLSYEGNVVRTKASAQRTERQFFQVGCEIIGQDSVQAEIETCALAVIGLSRLGIKEITVDLNMPGLIADIFADHDLSPEVAQKVDHALALRDFKELKEADAEIYKVLKTISHISGEPDKVFAALDDVDPKYVEHVERLRAFYDGLTMALEQVTLSDVSVTIDPAERQGFDYHNGVSFVVYAQGARSALGRGGRYDAVYGEGQDRESAVGFTLYMDTVCKVMPDIATKPCVEVGFDTSWDKLLEMYDQGDIIVRG